MANQDVSGPNEFFIRLGEVKSIGQSETVELMDVYGDKFLNVELGMLGRDDEVTDGSGNFIGKMQDKMHIGTTQGYRQRNILDKSGRHIATAMPKVPDPKPGERHFLLKDESNKIIAYAVTTQQTYPGNILIRNVDGGSAIGRMTNQFDGGSLRPKLDKTSSYKMNLDDSSIPRLLLLEFAVSVFLFVLRA